MNPISDTSWGDRKIAMAAQAELEQARTRIKELEAALESAALQYAHHDPERGIYHGPFAVLKKTKENDNG